MAQHASHEHTHSGLHIEVDRTGPCSATVKFSVEPDEFAKARSQSLRHMARHTRMKGFRPGKVPASMLEKTFGSEADRQTIQHFLNHAYETAVKDNELRPAANPRVDVENIEPPGKETFTHEFELILRPDVELGDYKGLAIAGQSLEVTGEEIEATVEDLKRQNSRPEPAGDEGVPEDGMLVGKLSFFEEGKEEPVLERDGMRLSPQTPPPGADREGFKEAMTGTKVGDSREVSITFEEGFPEPDVVGKPGTCRVEVAEAFRIVAPTDEELFKLLETEDEAAFREEVEKRIGEAKESREKNRLETELLDQLIKAHPIEVPAPLVDDQAESKVEELRKSLEGEDGLDEATLEERLETERQSTRESTTKALRAVYLMEEVARREEIEVTGADIELEMKVIAARNGVAEDDVRKYYREEGLLQQLALELLERKVRSFLRESADIQSAS